MTGPHANMSTERLLKTIRQRRKGLEITQKEMARCIGKSQAQLSRIESGAASTTVGVMMDMAAVVGLEIKAVPYE